MVDIEHIAKEIVNKRNMFIIEETKNKYMKEKDGEFIWNEEFNIRLKEIIEEQNRIIEILENFGIEQYLMEEVWEELIKVIRK